MTTDLTPMAPLSAEFDPGSAPSFEELVALLHRAHAEAPVFYWEAYGWWVVTRYEDVVRILRDPDTFTTRNKLRQLAERYPDEVRQILAPTSRGGEGALTMGVIDGAEHTRLRSSFTPSMTRRGVLAYEEGIRARCRQLVAGLAGRGHAEWMHDFALPLPLFTILDILGLPSDDAEQVAGWSRDLLQLIGAPLEPAEQAARARRVVEFEQYLQHAMDRCRAKPAPGLLSEVARATVDGGCRMTDQELLGTFTMELILGGHETTATALVTTLYHLLRDRRRWQALCERPELVGPTVEELLRYEPPLIGLFRITTKDVEIAGVRIPAGARIYWSNMGANHDETVFPQSAQIAPDRPNATANLSFGNGIHLCLGAHLARLELKVAYDVLIESLPSLRLAPTQGELSYHPSVMMRGPHELHVEWDA